ncbi:hypothetical protein [Microbacterium sp. ZW T5_56]|uniref:hypothetical protein n=1 Tax=Microbacterium sp. ZW T5_56 TaxID=3378081 RepID=UPI0038526AF1
MKNQAQWTLPLDEFATENTQLQNYAEQLLVGKCMSSLGYDWVVPWQDPDFPAPPDVNAAGLRLFDVAIAGKWGYHFAPSTNPEQTQAWSDYGEHVRSLATEPNFDSSFDSCIEDARDGDDILAEQDGNNFLSGLGMQATSVAESDPQVADALKEWHQCLSSAVDFTVGKTPWEGLLPDSVLQRFGLVGEQLSETASAEEIAVATADAECRESSQLSEKLYNIEWAEQQKLVDENRDKLEAIRAAGIARNDKSREIVAENAPPAP